MHSDTHWLAWLPTLNALLNGISALLLCTGYVFIRRRQIEAHRACMTAAFGVSALFLISYVTLHAQVGSTSFTGTGWVRPLYFFVLITHIVLAALVPFLALATLWRAWRQRFESHARLARWTLPVWLYVSVTGIAVYLMVYVLYP
jgi:putative membrane protein